MGMSGFILSLEEAYWNSVAEIVKDSLNVTEAMDRAVSLSKPMVPHLETEHVKDSVGEMWSDVWGNNL